MLLLLWGNLTIQAQVKPNVLIIIADDLGHNDMSYNDGLIKTPVLDEYANKGIIFNRFYTSAPVCSPTRGAVMTGRVPFRLGINGANIGRLEQDELNIAELLLLEGYTTGHFGKWHLGSLTTEVFDGNRGMPGDSSVFSPPWLNGFKYSVATESSVPTYNPMQADISEAYPLSFEDENYHGTAYWRSDDFKKGERVELQNLIGDDNEIITDFTLSFLDSTISNNEPFFCNLWYHTPHLPVVPREDFRFLYTDEEWNELPESERKFANNISSMDFHLSRVFDFLKEKNVLENTIIWFLSDNGPTGQRIDAVGPFNGRKNTIYEGGLRVPSFIYYPGLDSQQVEINQAVSTLDILPTLLDLIGLDGLQIDKPIDGSSIVSILESDENLCRETPIFCIKDGFRFTAIYEDNYKLISKNNNASWELYDLDLDVAETNDLKDEFPNLFERMRDDILSYQMRLENDEHFTNNICGNNTSDASDQIQLNIYPNPSNLRIQVEISDSLSIEDYCIYGINGQSYITNAQIAVNRGVLDISGLVPGMYFLKIEIDNNISVIRKFVKDR